MRLAFYAPMKPPDHPVPSGDRTIARGLLAALKHLGAEVTLASRFRSREGVGDLSAQMRLMRAAGEAVDEIVAEGQRIGWQVWVTYHNYYKAPDLIGPAVAEALSIPYVQIESTRAKKRLTGRWARYAKAAEDATDAAALVFYLSDRDAETLRRDAPAGQLHRHLRPFLTDAATLDIPKDPQLILTIGMMRQGDKLASYQIIAETLAALDQDAWRLDIAGDGSARGEVEDLLAPFGDKIRFLGQLDAEGVHAACAGAAIFLWPGVNEALGMVYLEAQAAGCAVVAQDRPGMREVLAPFAYPDVSAGPEGLAKMLAQYLSDPSSCQRSGAVSRDHVLAHHSLQKASESLANGLAEIGVTL